MLEDKTVIQILEELKPYQPRTIKTKQRLIALNKAIEAVKCDVDSIREEEYMNGYRDGKRDAFYAYKKYGKEIIPNEVQANS